MAFAVYGMAVVLAPALGPTFGGWIVDNASWRWLFFLNIPVGIISLFLTQRLVEDPPYLAARRKKREGIDYWGLGLLVLFIGSLQMMLDKGQEDDWFSSISSSPPPSSAASPSSSFSGASSASEHPIVDLRLFKRRNIAT